MVCVVSTSIFGPNPHGCFNIKWGKKLQSIKENEIFTFVIFFFLINMEISLSTFLKDKTYPPS